MKIFKKGLILPHALNFYAFMEDLQKGFDDYDDDDDDDDEDDDASPVVIAGPGKAQAFAV